MNCNDLDALLSDYLDGTLGPSQKAEVARHIEVCPSCAEMARDAAAGMAFLKAAAPVEPPPELVTRIVFELTENRPKPALPRRGLAARLRALFEPVLQPRFAMGMAMTILSLSLLARVAGINVRQLSLSDLDPVKVWQAADDRVYRGWMRARKFYYSLRFVYEIRSRIAELTAQQDEETGQAQAGPDADGPASGGSSQQPAPSGETQQKGR